MNYLIILFYKYVRIADPEVVAEGQKEICQRLDLKGVKWNFSISKSDFSDVKKLSSINGERIININIILRIS